MGGFGRHFVAFWEGEHYARKTFRLEFEKLVLYYLTRPIGVEPNSARPPNHLHVSSKMSHSDDNYSY
jgi:hypothetical protein